jgi:hypothetical protein
MENCHNQGLTQILTLVNILSEILKVGPGSKKVMNNYNTALDILGPELSILHNLSPEAIDKAGIPLLGEAVKRMRREEIDCGSPSRKRSLNFINPPFSYYWR